MHKNLYVLTHHSFKLIKNHKSLICLYNAVGFESPCGSYRSDDRYGFRIGLTCLFQQIYPAWISIYIPAQMKIYSLDNT